MRNLTKLVATAALGVAMSATFSAPSYATSANVTQAATYFFDCLKKLGTEDTCGGPHEMDTGTSSIASHSGSDYDPECHCGYAVVWEDGYYCYKSYGSRARRQ